jgi:4-amino-4-deoxy-L-arabinose transferase-like glycosyltransferase
MKVIPQGVRLGIKLTTATPETPSAIGRRDFPYIILSFFSFAVGLWASWQRWGNPLIDAGREMNVPLRLLRGEMLYSQVRYIYGPLAPYLNSELYHIFGVRLWALCAGGIAASGMILALVYWIGRRVLEPAETAVTVLAVTWICAFKPEGNYILPYAYSALHGCLLTLGVLALSLRYMERRRATYMLLAGVCAGLAMLAKTEAGIVGLATAMAAVLLPHVTESRRLFSYLLIFLAPAIAIPAAIYAGIAKKTGWATLTQESYLFFGHVPWQLIHFNQVRFGFDRPWHSLLLIVISLIRLLAFVGILGAVCLIMAGESGRANRRSAWALLVGSVALCAAASMGLGDLGPMLPMPIILALLLAADTREYIHKLRTGSELDTTALQWMLILAFSLLSLLRIFLRVSTGGALSSVLIPTSLLVFVFCWTGLFPSLFTDAKERILARRLAMAVLLVAIATSAITLSVRYRRKYTYRLATARGTMWTQPDLGRAFGEAANFLARNSKGDDFVAVAPEGTSLDFLCDRKNPLRDEILVPGMLDAEGEQRAIGDLQRTSTRFFLVTNRSTKEFGQTSFGRDYDVALMKWVEGNFRTCAILGSDPSTDPQVGDARFFIRVYCRK